MRRRCGLLVLLASCGGTTTKDETVIDADGDGSPSTLDCDPASLTRSEDAACDEVLTHPAGAEMVLLEGGRFRMDSRGTENGHPDAAHSTGQTSEVAHGFPLTRDFSIGITAVTNLALLTDHSTPIRWTT